MFCLECNRGSILARFFFPFEVSALTVDSGTVGVEEITLGWALST